MTNQHNPSNEDVTTLSEYFYQLQLRLQALQTRVYLVEKLAVDAGMELAEIHKSVVSVQVHYAPFDTLWHSPSDCEQIRQIQAAFPAIQALHGYADQLSINDKLLYKVVGLYKHHSSDRTYPNFLVFSPQELEAFRQASMRFDAEMMKQKAKRQNVARPEVQPSSDQTHQPIRGTFAQLRRLRGKALAQGRQAHQLHHAAALEPVRESVRDLAFQETALSLQAHSDVGEAFVRFCLSGKTYDDLFELSSELMAIYAQGYSKSKGDDNAKTNPPNTK
ncbi:hypothetical protein L4F92_07610 [Avibacterium sp. 21-595]|uniref:hypothetical protein n=1 Tax=Avibacterium sp. 21-595 TaxID=2911527 RepID=UPI002026CEEF|nr:hypothetical protein [Avibacterium sp. 21-595]URL05939.1 hypothetical protein L4F92_07610 [Avibacterium sp. 21-595]